jgi:RNA 2',3'-cyclic 3'-phosphodiesterase
VISTRRAANAHGDRARGEEARVRLFVALELPAEIRAALAEWCATAVDERSVRPLDPGSLHVTLCFLGWCAADQVSQIAAACDEVAAERPVELRVREAVWLPRRRPRVLAVALEDLWERLARVQEDLTQPLQAGGWYVPERRRFLAHVTVARMRRGAAPPGKQLQAPPQLSVIGDRVTLFRSTLQAGGAQYEALHSVTIGG